MYDSNFTKQLKELVGDFVSADGEILDYPIGRIGCKKLDDRRIKLLKIFIDLLINTRFTRDVTKLYISQKYITFEGVAEQLQAQGQEICVSSVQSRVFYDKRRIEIHIGGNILVDILEYKNVDLDRYEQKLLDLMVQHSNGYMFQTIALHLPTPTFTTDLSEEEFEEFFRIIAPFSKNHMKFISDNIDTKALGYCKYIISSNVLTEVDKERRDRVLALLGCEE